MKTIKDRVAEDIASFFPDVVNDVINTLVDEEKAKRSTAIASVYRKFLKTEADLENAKKQVKKTYKTDGTVDSEFYSQETMAAIQKFEEQLEKFEKSFEKASKGQMGDVYNIAKSEDKGSGKGDKGTPLSTSENAD